MSSAPRLHSGSNGDGWIDSTLSNSPFQTANKVTVNACYDVARYATHAVWGDFPVDSTQSKFQRASVPFLYPQDELQPKLTFADNSAIQVKAGDLLIPIKLFTTDLTELDASIQHLAQGLGGAGADVHKGIPLVLPSSLFQRLNLENVLQLKYGEQLLDLSIKEFDPAYVGTPYERMSFTDLLQSKNGQVFAEGFAYATAPRTVGEKASRRQYAPSAEGVSSCYFLPAHRSPYGIEIKEYWTHVKKERSDFIISENAVKVLSDEFVEPNFDIENTTFAFPNDNSILAPVITDTFLSIACPGKLVKAHLSIIDDDLFVWIHRSLPVPEGFRPFNSESPKDNIVTVVRNLKNHNICAQTLIANIKANKFNVAEGSLKLDLKASSIELDEKATLPILPVELSPPSTPRSPQELSRKTHSCCQQILRGLKNRVWKSQKLD